ncbi:MAG TPA: mannonate dehydratase [Pirellulales bacterium]|jgi:mannonate dehydratase
MKRRNFLGGVTAAVSAAWSTRAMADEAADARTTSGAKSAMHVGCQNGPTTPKLLDYFKRHGVDHICGFPPDPGAGGHWSVDDLKRTKDLCEKHGVSLDMVALPFLTSSHIDRERRGSIMMAAVGRDQDIEDIQRMIEACAAVEIPAIKYNLSLLGVLRTDSTPGRGGSRYSTWKLAEAKGANQLTRAGHVSADKAWDRITYFLDRVIPVCNQYKIRAACHPHDPGTPPAGFQGIVNVLGTVDGLKRFVAIQESPFHGLNFCVGTVAEMLQDPRSEICGVVRYFGQRDKIFNIHFRNIRGRRDDFCETYPDNGDLDMLAVARTLNDVGYSYMLMPDHMPSHADDSDGLQAFAFGYGYIKGLLQAIAST